jgi:DNA repair exonuclease SbcCD nuclease subunit
VPGNESGPGCPEWRETETMLRLLHLSDVHLGARHPELGAAGAAQRERQWEAFERALELAATDECAVVVISGDLFDSNAQPRRSVERAAKALGAAVTAGLTVAILPGDCDPFDAGSVYRTYDLAALAGMPDSDGIHVLEPGRRTLVLPALDLAIRAYPAGPETSLDEALAEPRDEAETGVRLRVGVAHVAPDGAPPSEAALLAAGLDYLALGGLMAPSQGTAGAGQWADPGPLESLGDSEEAGGALLLTLDPDARRRVRIEQRPVGRTHRRQLELSVDGFQDEGALVGHLSSLADADLAYDVRLTGTRPADLRVDEAALEAQLAPGFLHLRIHDESLAPVPAEPPPAPESIAGAFLLDVGSRMAAATAEGRAEDARELGDELDLGLRLLAGSTGMPV